MGGEITLEQAGQGRAFASGCPRAARRARRDVIGASAALHSLPAMTILVADDIALNRHLIEALFRDSPHRLIMAEDGEQAVAADASPADGRPDGPPCRTWMASRHSNGCAPMPTLAHNAGDRRDRIEPARRRIRAAPALRRLRAQADHARRPHGRTRACALAQRRAEVRAATSTTVHAIRRAGRRAHRTRTRRARDLAAAAPIARRARRPARLAELLLELAQRCGSRSLERYAQRLKSCRRAVRPSCTRSDPDRFSPPAPQLARICRTPSNFSSF